MNGFVYKLPPTANVPEVKSEQIDLQGYLELEVSLINFITNNTNAEERKSGKLPEHKVLSVKGVKEKAKKQNTNDTPFKGIINNKYSNNSASVNEITKEIDNKHYHKLDNIQVQIVWCGERREDAAHLNISCKSQYAQQQHQQPQHNDHCKLNKTKRKYNQQQHIKRHHHHHCEQPKDKQARRQQNLPLSANNKLRYRICTSGALFLEYLRSCKPIEIIVTAASSVSGSTAAKPLGQAQLRLPLVLLKKFNHNIVKGHNFAYKTKVYTLYNTNHETFDNKLVKSGEIQLIFKMLFAPTAAASATAVAAAQPGEHHLHNNHCHHHHHHRHHHLVGAKANNVAEDVQGDIPKRLTSQTKSEEIVEAMKKLDAKLVAYLAGETEITSKLTNCEEENEVNLNLENQSFTNNLEDLLPATKFNIFKSINSIKLEMEALTLQPEGTKCMQLMQNEIEPIFTVECQLSNELIKQVPRHDMFHIMQFESEKFQSLTQCSRFGQQAERAVKLALDQELSDENANETELDFGRIHFTVWWREPGTCLNEMLGMGVLELNDLYNASLLEQCKRIEIVRRGKQLACLYFKIILQRDGVKSSSSALQMKRELFLPKQLSSDSDSEKTSPDTDNNKNTTGQQQQTAQCGTGSSAAAATSSSKLSATDKASAQNNNVKFDTTNFDDETSKIRLLKGFISANETRNLEISQQPQTILVCRRFWLDEPATAKADTTCKFNYQEQFSVINDDKFLQRVDKQYLHLELWQRMSCDDGNGNPQEENAQPVGMVRMPLHQFFIAYRDAAITNHLCKGKLPVISIDAWAPIVNCQTGLNVGEIKCLLAVGSDEQIKNLKESRGLLATTTLSESYLTDKDFITKLEPLQMATSSKTTQPTTKQATPTAASSPLTAAKIKKTSDLLDMLQKVLMTSPASAGDCQPSKAATVPATVVETKQPSTAASALTPLKPSNVKLFKFSLEIQKAIGLPLNPASKAKKGYSKRNASKRFPPNEAPSCYVTFQADEGQYPTYKSHEGMVFATNIVEKSTQPQWQQRFRLAASIDYLKIPQKLFILKVLKKSSLDMAQGRQQPTPMEDAIIGLTALDLSAFARGLHIAGTFNIVDFNGRINGQLLVRCQPLEDITPAITTGNTMPVRDEVVVTASTSAGSSVDSVIDQFEQTLDLTHLNLGQAIKRKFTELEGISQRLRARLGDVTGEELPKNFDLHALNAWQPMDKEANDEFDEFEHDLNTPPPLGEEEEVVAAEDNKNKLQVDDEQKLKDNKYQGKTESDGNENSE